MEGNHYFPPETINQEFFKESDSHTICGWKGVASYYNVEVDGQVNNNAAWYYPSPSQPAKQIEGYDSVINTAFYTANIPIMQIMQAT